MFLVVLANSLCCCILATTKPAIIGEFLQQQEKDKKVFIFFLKKNKVWFCFGFSFWNGSFASPVGLKYPLSSLFWPLHFRWPFKACQRCSPSYQPCFLGQLSYFIFANVLPSCAFPWFYSFSFLGLASGLIQLHFGAI